MYQNICAAIYKFTIFTRKELEKIQISNLQNIQKIKNFKIFEKFKISEN